MILSIEQVEYMRTREAYEKAKRSVERSVKALTPPTRQEIHAGVERGDYCEGHPYYVARTGIEERYGLDERRSEALAAENALIEWAAGNARRGLGDRFNAIEVVFERGVRLVGKTREKLLDICVRMEVAS